MARHLKLGTAALFVTLVGAMAATPSPLEQRDWQQYRSRFIMAEGRVRDTGNGGISHSEGQGYGMLLAVAYRDAIWFDRLWRWTRRHLQIRDDRLFAWKWNPDAAEDPVPDRNDAADGDLLIALALARAADLWDAPSYRDAAQAIARDVLDRLVRQVEAWTVLLPGVHGFVHDQTITVNLSYWIFPALLELDRIAPSPDWQRLTTTGLALLREARFGPFELPPDWLALDRSPWPSPRHPPVFGYDAARIPMHLVWGGIDDPELLSPYLDYAATHRDRVPATIDLNDGRPSAEPASPGVEAVFALTRWAVDGTTPRWPRLDPDADYYTASLWMLSKLAYAERSSR